MRHDGSARLLLADAWTLRPPDVCHRCLPCHAMPRSTSTIMSTPNPAAVNADLTNLTRPKRHSSSWQVLPVAHVPDKHGAEVAQRKEDINALRKTVQEWKATSNKHQRFGDEALDQMRNASDRGQAANDRAHWAEDDMKKSNAQTTHMHTHAHTHTHTHTHTRTHTHAHMRTRAQASFSCSSLFVTFLTPTKRTLYEPSFGAHGDRTAHWYTHHGMIALPQKPTKKEEAHWLRSAVTLVADRTFGLPIVRSAN